MIEIRCTIHNVNYRLAQTHEEFVSGIYHDDIIKLQDHVDENPDCVFVEVLDD